MAQDVPRTDNRDRDELPLERELEGLPELDRFGSASERAAALHAVHRRLEDPYAPTYWFWVALLVCVALVTARAIGWSVRLVGAPAPFPAALGLVVGLAVYMLLYRLVIRWAARTELRELAARRTEQQHDSGSSEHHVDRIHG